MPEEGTARMDGGAFTLAKRADQYQKRIANFRFKRRQIIQPSQLGI